ncbi:calcium-binding protein [Shimia sagamensis]|uniref:Ca2+-binding protein, RTX toxin-related n=1 Tax=Shimia sagamensis TaxID=1566352 RepID=A0ABY1NVL8_9RHOB|nr:calcium-binding protein [Shimia sagamensis]SMP19216.1 Ca2+-binding protein, RTX toxin-related [Shimia sagamensis]
MTLENALSSPLNAPEPDIGDTPATARIVDVGETVTSAFDRWDTDVIGVTLEAGKIYEFAFAYAPGSGLNAEDHDTLRSYISRFEYDADRDRYLNWGSIGDNNGYYNHLPQRIETAGTYFINFRHRAPDDVEYTFTINEVTDPEGNTIAEATSVNLAESTVGSLDYDGDADMFEVTLEDGKRYAINITLGDGRGEEYIPLKILDDQGNVVADFNLKSPDILAFTPSEGGTYYLFLEHSGVENLRNQTISYSHLGEYDFQIIETEDILGADTDDRIIGTNGDDVIRAAGGNDKVFSRKGNDVVHLGSGNDYVRAGGGREEFHGGSGHDTISYYNSSKGVTINLATNAASRGWATNDAISGFESVTGSRIGHDKIYGTSGANTIKTFGGNDKIYAGDGNDTIYAGDGNDKVYGGKGNDTIFLGDGNDYVRVAGGREEFHGGEGNDTISYYDSKTGVNINLQTHAVSGSWATNDIISGFENVTGSKNGSDRVIGTRAANLIKTHGGNDTISSEDGNDTIYGGDGNDKIIAGDGDDKVYGGKGNDYISLGFGNDYVKAGGGRERFDGGFGNDYISYFDSPTGVDIDLDNNSVSGGWSANDTIKNFEGASGSNRGHDEIGGNDFSNLLRGNGGNDTLYGARGTDQLYGGSGNDELYGGSDNDVLFGGTGKDILDGGDGNDTLTGGTGADVFQFRHWDGNDTITDFKDDADTLELYGFRDTDGDGQIALIYGFDSRPGIEIRFDNGQSLFIETLYHWQIGDDVVQL